jgi:DNA-binding SARP family transcriptional activator
MLQVSLLGERTVIDADTGQVRARSPRAVALIAFLAAHAGAPQPRGRIAAAFWPDSTEQQALTNLRRELHQLRRLLGGDPSLVVTGTDLAWRDSPTCRVDLRGFRVEHRQAAEATEPARALFHGRAALGAYGGDLLPGLFDDWVLELREELGNECTELCELVMDTGRATGSWPDALAAGRRRVALRPLEETGYRQLIELQVEMGDRAGAVGTYHHCASVLERELGIQPHPATRAALDTMVPNPPFRRGAVAPAPDLIGRGREYAVLDEAVRGALAGASRLVLLRGEPGVGKTRLLAEATAPARKAGTPVATAQCYAGAGRLALAPVAEWLQDPAIRSGLEGLTPGWRAEVERLLPSGSGTGGPGVPRGIADAWQRHRFFQGLARALLAADGPLVLVLDNLQWCDAETLDLLAFLAGEQEHGLALLMAGRAQELVGATHQVEWLRRMRSTGMLTEVELLPLRQQDTAELAALLGGGPLTDDAATELQAATGGFPLFVVEAARAGGLAVPLRPSGGSPARGRDLTAVLHARLAQLHPESQDVAGLAAASGRDFDLALLCEASDLSPEGVVRAIDELWRLRIVDEHRTGYDFSHDLLRAAAYDEVSPPRRWLLHRRLAQALELLHAGHTDEVAAQLAEQYTRAGNPQRAFQHYRRAADLAAGVFAYAEVIRHNEAALALLPQLPAGPDHDELEMHALRSLAASLNALRGYADPELAATLERLVELAERPDLADTLGDSLVSLWSSRFVQGRNRPAHDLAARALELTDELRQPSALSAHAHFAFGGSALHLGRPREAVEHLELACERFPDEASLIVGSHPAVHARAWVAHAYWRLGETATAAASAEAATERARRLGRPYDLAIALGYGAVTWQLLDERQRLEVAAEELAALGDRYRLAYYTDWGVVLAGWARGGDAGAQQIRSGLAALRRIGAFARMAYWLTLLADTTRDRPRARALIDAAAITARVQADGWWGPEVERRRDERTPGRTPGRTLDERLPS